MGNKPFILNFVRYDDNMNPIYEHNGLYFKDSLNHASATDYIYQLMLFDDKTCLHDIHEFYWVENKDIIFRPARALL